MIGFEVNSIAQNINEVVLFCKTSHDEPPKNRPIVSRVQNCINCVNRITLSKNLSNRLVMMFGILFGCMISICMGRLT